MSSSWRDIVVPKYYKPWPHQVEAWLRRTTGQYNYDVKLWCRQAGKDTDDIQFGENWCWENPGKQIAYVGLDNGWITNNIFKKYIDGRTHWMDYPSELIDVKETQKEVYMLNNPKGIAPSRMKFIGFLNDQALIGSSYDMYIISEGSLYKPDAFQFMTPIWDSKLAQNEPLMVLMNGTPRGTRNVFYDFIRTYTGCDDPEDFPGAHGNCYVDKKTVYDLMVPDGEGGYKRKYTDEYIELLKERHLLQYGHLQLFNQESMCDFTAVNAGLVYRGIEQLEKQGRYTPINLDTSRPVYVALDIASKSKFTDATAAIVFQYYNGQMFIYDWYESRGKALAECIADLAQRPYFHLIRRGILPWDSESYKTVKGPVEELQDMFPNIEWHVLGQSSVRAGIEHAWKLFPNIIINKNNCGYVMDCFMNYEFRRLRGLDDYAKPVHSKWSHMMDAFRYACVGINEISYLRIDDSGARSMPASYGSMFDNEEKPLAYPVTYGKPKKEKEDFLEYY